MRTVWLPVVVILIAGLAPMCAAVEANKDIPIYDGKAGVEKGDVCVNPKDGAKMVWVPAGEFTMGGMDEETAAALKEFPEDSQDFGEFFLNAEKPERKVHLDGYWIYKHEVTVAQYRKFCEATKTEMPKAPEWGWKDDHPMVMVTWQDAADYGKWAGASLPTEAQWEKAARGTDKRIYPWGNKWDASRCANSVETKLKSTQPVGGYASGASPYGCIDMAGNVREWCADLYDPHYYENAPAKNPKGPSEVGGVIMPVSGKDNRPRVLRGGSWQFDSNYAFHCIDRGNDDPTIRYNTGGFRCAATP
jgi:sulfatase modifying factor 1